MVCMRCLHMDKNEAFLPGMAVDWTCRAVVTRPMIRKVVCMLYLHEIAFRQYKYQKIKGNILGRYFVLYNNIPNFTMFRKSLHAC